MPRRITAACGSFFRQHQRQFEIQPLFSVSLAAVFQLNTVAQLAAFIEERTDTVNGKRHGISPSTSLPANGLDPEIYRKLVGYTAGWKGQRIHPESLLFGLNCAGTKPPLYWCLQGFAELKQLAKHLGPDQPVYGMRSGHLVMEYTRENVEALAGHYLAEIMRVIFTDYGRLQDAGILGGVLDESRRLWSS